ncbi:MAG: lasso peptide biosynthesis B2 protein [Methanothrix sp.]|nr:lasso peptide biosynthesis B2 protein [Methanothrix sp.]
MASLRLIKFLELPYWKKKCLIIALAILWSMRIKLWLLPYPSVRKTVSSIKVAQRGDRLLVEDIVQSVDVASQYVMGASCLTKALAAKMLLARNGYDSTLRIGVNSCNGFAAHAWIEHNGEIILGESDQYYNPIYVLE